MTQRNSFGLVGDGDDMDLIPAIEQAFWIEITDAEAEKVMNMGDLHDLVCTKLVAGDGRRSACLSAGAFYRLRRALVASGISDQIGPRTDLRSLMLRDGDVRRRWKELGKVTGLRLPALELSTNGFNLWLASGLVLVGAAMWAGSIYMVGAALILWLSLNTRMPHAVPPHLASVGDLSHAVLAYNYGKLCREFDCTHRDDLWRALVTVVRDACATGYMGVVDRDTVFFDSQLDKPRG